MAVVDLELESAVLTVTLNRPDKLNAINGEVLAALAHAWSRAAAPDVRVVVVTGAGRGFSSGQDIADLPAEAPVLTGLRHAYNPVILSLWALEKPVIAAVNGPAAGAGIGLACAADIRISADTAVFVPGYARFGLVPDAGVTYFAPRLMGYGPALAWLASGEAMAAAAAHEAGLVDRVVASADLLPTVRELARSLAAMPASSVTLTKQLLRRSATATLADQLDREAATQDVARAARPRQARPAAVRDHDRENRP